MTRAPNDDYVSSTLRAYDDSVDIYEEATRDMPLSAQLADFVDQLPRSEFSILDAGCGFGRDTALLADRGLPVIGIDLSEGLLARARELRPELIFSKVDVRNTGFADESLRGIWCNATLLHLTDEHIHTALAEFVRILMPGGIVFISFKEGTGSENLLERFSSRGRRFFNYQTLETTRDLVEGHGLRVTKITVVNERDLYGPDKRDLNWVHCFAKKPSIR